jgi:hypothetical protein
MKQEPRSWRYSNVLRMDSETEKLMFEEPSVATRVREALYTASSAQHKRLLKHVWLNPGSFTHEIARNCGIGNVCSRVSEINRGVLLPLGLSLNGAPQPGHVNRFGDPCREHRWSICEIK